MFTRSHNRPRTTTVITRENKMEKWEIRRSVKHVSKPTSCRQGSRKQAVHTFSESWTSFSSVQFSCSVVSDSLRPHELEHTRPPCPSPTPGVYLNSCPSSRWCHPAISSSVVPFSSCPQSLPASGPFPISQLFAWGGQSIGVLWKQTEELSCCPEITLCAFKQVTFSSFGVSYIFSDCFSVSRNV